MKANTQRITRYTAIGLCLFAAAVAFYLLRDHREHFLGWLPYLLLLTCPLMHLFMHRSHGRGRAADAAHDATPARDPHNPPDLATS